MEKNPKKRGLGRGPNAPIGGTNLIQGENETQSVPQPQPASEEKPAAEVHGGIQMMDIYEIEPDYLQPRQYFDRQSLEELTESIKQYGVLQPLIVQKKDGCYQIIAGERRWRAAKDAGLKEIPVIIKEYSDEETIEISLIENIQREDLNPIEEAQAYQRLMNEYHLNQEEVALKVGKSRSAIANFLRLLRLEESVQRMVADGSISMGHAKALMSVRDLKKQKELANMVFQRDLSVRQLEKLVYMPPKEKKEISEESDVQTLLYASMEQRMQDILGTKVNVVRGKKKGKIEIEYYPEEDLERIYELLKRTKE